MMYAACKQDSDKATKLHRHLSRQSKYRQTHAGGPLNAAKMQVARSAKHRFREDKVNSLVDGALPAAANSPEVCLGGPEEARCPEHCLK